MNILYIVIALIIATVIYIITIYNKLVSLSNSIDASESDIDVQLKRRYNLIPSLVDIVKGYTTHESDMIDKVVSSRQQGLNATNIKEKSLASSMISSALGKIFALAEAYPDLKANENFLKLQEELANIEDSIQNARRYYNAITRDYNISIKSFPDLIIANKYNFRVKNYFELDENEVNEVRKMPKINI